MKTPEEVGATMRIAVAQVCDTLTRRLAAMSSDDGSPRTAATTRPVAALPEVPLVVLIADDEPKIVNLVGRWLADVGRPWMGATTLAEAAMALAQHRVERVVLDWVWPDGSAYMIACMCTQRRIPCCIYTGLEPDKISIQGLRVDVIQKPGWAELRSWLGLEP